MKLEPAAAAYLEATDRTAARGADIVATRQNLGREIDRIFTLFGQPGPPVHAIRDHLVPVEDATIRLRTYHPADTGPLPVHIVFHGGGWSTGSIDEMVCDATARHRAVGAGCVVALVDYRLAPEHQFPVPVHDAIAAVRWVRDHADELGVRPDLLTLGGASAGANLAAAAVLAAGDLQPTAVVLEVPALDLSDGATFADIDLDPPYEEVLSQSREDFIRARAMYLGDTSLGMSPLASPLLTGDLSHFPPTYLLTAELDVLRASADLFAHRLREAGVPVELTQYAGALHGSPILTASWPTAEVWQDDIAAILRGVHRSAERSTTARDAGGGS